MSSTPPAPPASDTPSRRGASLERSASASTSSSSSIARTASRREPERAGLESTEEATRHRAAARGASTDLDDSHLTCLVGYAASRASIELKKSFARSIGPFDVKASEFSILMLLAANADVNQKQLGATLDISPPNMAVTLDRMVARGWVERVRSTRDRRAQQIHLTTAGAELARKTERISRSMESSALRMLSGAERALLLELLQKVATGSKGPPPSL